MGYLVLGGRGRSIIVKNEPLSPCSQEVGEGGGGDNFFLKGEAPPSPQPPIIKNAEDPK